MKLKKILAAAAAATFAVCSLAVGTSANLYIPENNIDPSLIIKSDMWLIQLYNVGNPAENKPAVDRSLDVTKVASMTAYIEIVDGKVSIEEYDPALDGFGGSMIWSANGGDFQTLNDGELQKKFNWVQGFNDWWGLPEKDDTFEGRPEANGGEGTNTGTANWDASIVLKYIRKFAYSLTVEIPDEYRWPTGAGCYQVGLQEWGKDEYLNAKVAAYVINDDDGNILLAFDELGNEIDETKLNKIIEDLSVPVVDDEGKLLGGDTPSDSTTDNAGENTSANEESTASTEGNNNSNNTTAITTDSSSSNPPSNSNVGLVIGIVAGIVVIGGGIGAVSVLRKK